MSSLINRNLDVVWPEKLYGVYNSVVEQCGVLWVSGAIYVSIENV